MTQKLALEINGLQVGFGPDQSQSVIRDLTFSVPAGQFVCIVGPSGCGKTTLLSTVAGFIAPVSGSVVVFGQPVESPGPDRGIVFQDRLLFPWKTVFGNVAFGPRMQGHPKAAVAEAVQRLISDVGLSGFELRYPYELSGGMSQRVAIARTLAADPRLIMMDEPFGALDSQTRIDVQELLLRIWASVRKTVLFVTHDVDEALLLADRILVMSARPAHIVEDLPVEFPRPRDPEGLLDRNSVDLRALISRRIRDEQRRMWAAGAPASSSIAGSLDTYTAR